MNIFEFNDHIKTYSYPIIKIIICCMILILCYFREKIVPFSNKTLFIITLCVVFILIITCIKCIYISVFEIQELYNCRKKEKRNVSELCTKEYSVDSILNLVESNDIVEIEIKVSNNIIKVGSSSDSKWKEDELFDKLYYCGTETYKNVEDFHSIIMELSKNGNSIEVVSIDGVLE